MVNNQKSMWELKAAKCRKSRKIGNQEFNYKILIKLI